MPRRPSSAGRHPETRLLNLGKANPRLDRAALVWILGVVDLKRPATTRLRMIREKIQSI